MEKGPDELDMRLWRDLMRSEVEETQQIVALATNKRFSATHLCAGHGEHGQAERPIRATALGKEALKG